MTSTDFRSLGLDDSLLRGLDRQRFTTPTPIQAASIPLILNGKDLLGIAQTGTGKTAAFALPILQQLSGEKAETRQGRIRALILAPTRELVVQIEETLRLFTRDSRLFSLPVYGGVGRRPQIDRLRRGVDIVVATPGRFMDLLQEGHINLSGVKHLVLDEADRMLDMGFIHDIRRIVSGLPKARQTMLLSATMPKTVAHLAEEVLNAPERIEMKRETVAPTKIEQRVIHVGQSEKRTLLTNLLGDQDMARVAIRPRPSMATRASPPASMRSSAFRAARHGSWLRPTSPLAASTLATSATL